MIFRINCIRNDVHFDAYTRTEVDANWVYDEVLQLQQFVYRAEMERSIWIGSNSRWIASWPSKWCKQCLSISKQFKAVIRSSQVNLPQRLSSSPGHALENFKIISESDFLTPNYFISIFIALDVKTIFAFRAKSTAPSVATNWKLTGIPSAEK